VSSPADADNVATRLDALRDRLGHLAAALDVFADGALVVVRHCAPDGPPPVLLDAAARRILVDAARESGFTHIALELARPTGEDAAQIDADVRRPESGR